MVFLTFSVWIYLYVLRVPETKHMKTNLDDLQTRTQAAKLLTVSAATSDNLKNLFEMPVLFYLVAMLAMLLLIQDVLLIRLAWGFVILRIVHSVIHCTYNRVMHRFIAYIASCLFLILMWIRLATYILMN
jgi:hypothetical protein